MSEKTQILVQAFLNDIVRRVEEDVRQRLEAALGDIFVGKMTPKAAKAVVAKAKPEPQRTIKRRKLPKQYCPVPGCKNVAAPIFGMVCGDHKSVAKSKIAKYRLARKKAKAEGKTSKKPVAKKPVSKKPATKKPVSKKPVAKKPAAKKLVVKKPVTKKPTVAKKPVSKKSVSKKPVAKKAPTEVKTALLPSGGSTTT